MCYRPLIPRRVVLSLPCSALLCPAVRCGGGVRALQAYKAFLEKLMSVGTAERYTAADALKDPWILGDDWDVAKVDAMLAAMDDSSVRSVPSVRRRAEECH